jgi:DNA-binding protein HU-beta
MAYAFRVIPAKESAEDRQKRLSANRQFRQEKEDKLERLRHGGAKADLETANIYLLLGIDYPNIPDKSQLYELVRFKFHNRREDSLPEEIVAVLMEHFGADIQKDAVGIPIIKIPRQGEEEEGKEMKLYSQLARSTGQSRKLIRQVYEALVSQIHYELKHERVMRLPDLGIIRVAYRKALPKRQGIVPFTGEKKMFAARPASNKLRFRPAKPLKEYVDRKVKVQAPKKK